MAGQTTGLITSRFGDIHPGSEPVIQWYTRACPVCTGDVHEDASDGGWGTCIICARSFPVEDLLRTSLPPGVFWTLSATR